MIGHRTILGPFAEPKPDGRPEGMNGEQARKFVEFGQVFSVVSVQIPWQKILASVRKI